MKNLIRESLFAGILIGLGAFGFLALGGIPGAVIFTFGLVGVVLTKTLLYTGQAGVLGNIWDVTKIWFFNIVACAVIGLLAWYLGGEPVERARTIVDGRLAGTMWGYDDEGVSYHRHHPHDTDIDYEYVIFDDGEVIRRLLWRDRTGVQLLM